MVVSKTTREAVPYVLQSEREIPEEQRTVFTIATLDNGTMSAIANLAAREHHDFANEVAIRAGLRNWERFPQADGTPTPFKCEKGERLIRGVAVKNPITTETYELIPWGILAELVKAILDLNTLTTGDVTG
jgi:hypothetical protein